MQDNQYNIEIDNSPEIIYDKESLIQNSKFGFIRKVYLILSVQIFVTLVLCSFTVSINGYAIWQFENPYLSLIAITIAVIVEISLLCFRENTRKVPNNYILLSVFTICFSYSTSQVCSEVIAQDPSDGAQLVIAAGIMTFLMTVSLTAYAYVTKNNFTYLGGVFWNLLVCLFLFGIFSFIFQSQILIIFYLILGIFMYGAYIIYDTQLILGNRSYSLVNIYNYIQQEVDDYIVGALILYIDIVVLFLKILRLLQYLKRK